MKDIMLDLETMDNRGTASIVTVGAVEFDPTTGIMGKEFYRIVDLQTSVDAGLTIKADTVYWWLGQSKAAREEITKSNTVSLKEGCEHFVKYCEDVSDRKLTSKKVLDDVRIWGNGATFDNAIFRYAFSCVGVEFPVAFWNDRDVRTVVGFYPPKLFKDYKDNNMRDGYHNALSDSKYQVGFMSHIIKELGVTELY
jgi:hypothetical protein